MSGRGSRKRGRPPKTPNDRVTGKFNYQLLKKPKYLSKTCESQPSTPSISRASSPQESDGSRSINRKLNTKGRPGRGRKSVSHAQSSTSFSSRRGYESEYHYGSDFGDSTDKSDVDDDLILSASEEDSFDRGNESESEFSVCSFNQSLVGRPPRPPSPDPVWLQGREYPFLYLPDSSEDLLIENMNVMDALGVYEVLRRFRHLVRLSPFRFEDFCAALVCDEQSALLSDVHIMLLKAILREEDVQGTHFGPLDQKDSVNISLYHIDCVTWPEVLRSYVESDHFFDRKVYHILSNGEYPYVSVQDRITILQFLTDQFLTTNAVRDVMLQEGPIHYDDHCRICHRLGKLLCCETCPAVYHLECVDPPLLDVPTEDWQCNLCKSHKVTGVVDCVLLQEKHGVLVRHDALGLDRHGRKFWFVARRIFVEDHNRENVWYYSTISKFELLLNLLDKEDLEAGLHAQLNERKTEIIRQIKITESITNEHKKNRKSYIEYENEITNSLIDSTNDASTSNKLYTENKIMTRQKKSQISNGTLYFKLGMENSFKNYINQYTTNSIALNKPQRNEERDKRRHLSHKFSLTTASEFKWFGLSMGTAENIVSALRQTLINFEQNIAAPFMNPNWVVIKKMWNTAVMNCRSPKDFSTVLLLFQSSVKNVIFANVWHEQLGHIALQRITSSEREERKKIEKREKRERDEEEERNRLSVNYIKYSLGLKHQVWKQKGEEYRVHGQWGWMWLSSSRRCGRFRKRHFVTQAIPAFKTNVHYIYENSNEIINVDPRTQKFIQQCEISSQKGFNYNCLKNFKDVKIQTIEAIQNDIGVINVSMALNMPGRLLYPKVAKICRLDNLLERRIKLKEYEEQQILKSEEDEKTSPQYQVSSSEIKSPHKTFLEKRLLSLLESQKVQSTAAMTTNVNLDLVKSLAKKIQTVRFQFSQLNRFAKQYRCYTKECNTNSNAVSQITQNTCYSPLCLQKARAKKELLLLLRKAHAAGNGSKETVAAILGAVKKPSILEQKLTEGKKDIISTYDDTDEYKSVEETPIDLTLDWEQARAAALQYDDKLLSDCYEPFIPCNSRSSVKDEPLDIGYVGAESKMDFIENIEVCSNVEVESSETTEDSLAGLAMNNDDFDPLQLKKNRKSQKIKHKPYIGTKDVLDQTLDREIAPTRQNRRFPIHSRGVKREDVNKIEKEFFPNGKEKLYSVMSTRGRIYLLRDISCINECEGKDSTKTENISKYPLISNFLTHKLTPSILVLPRFELMQLARNGGKISANGFHHLAKSNQIWPYPCSRPLFKTCWAYRTCNAPSLSCVALQLRILWSCMRWDDMISKPPTTDGKHQVTTESEIVTLELLKLRNSGRYGERTTYLRRKVVVPLEMPKTIREVTSIRSGLRKRKRAESPQPTEPQVSEEWVEEDKLELWEIRFIGEKQEKSRVVATTRSAVTVRQNEAHINPTISAAGPNNNTSNANSKPTIVVKSQEDNKDQTEQVKVQRVSQTNKTRTDPTKVTTQVKGTVIGNRRVIVKNPDGTTRIIQQAITSTSPKNISHQNGLNSSLPQVASPNASSISGQQQVSTPSQPHKVQIIRGPDGKVSVRGLNPGQQLIQMPDGKLHVLTTSATSPQANKVKLAVKPTIQSNTPLIKQFNVKPVTKTPTAVQQIQKITTVPVTQNKSAPKLVTQIANQQTNLSQNDQKSSGATPNNKHINTVQNVQQLIVPPGQKLLVGQNAQGQKVIISSGNQTVASGQTQISTTSQALHTQPAYQQQQQQQQQQQSVINPTASAPSSQTQSTQKVIQQIVNTSNVQQQIMVGGQRIILSPGQTIVTQRSLPSNSQYPAVSSQPTQVVIQPNQGASLQSQPQSKVVKQITVQQQSTQETHVLNNVSPSTSNCNNSSVSNNQQIVVQNSTLAQQLAQGKLQVATINGQQVIIKPLGNNQAQIVAHIKTQSDGNAHIVTNSQLDNQSSPNKPTTAQSQIQNLPVRQTQQSTVAQHDNANISQTQSSSQQQMSIEESLLQGQPPGTVIKCVTAQVIQTDQGPRIVLQGLVGNDFSSQQLALVQQQVKQQLLKAQESSGKQGVLGPTKVYLAVQPANPTTNSQPPPLTPVMPSSHQQALYLTKTSFDSNTNKIYDASLDAQQVVQQTSDENKNENENENIHKTFEGAVLKDNVIKNGDKNFTLQTHQSLERKELSVNARTNNAVVKHSLNKRNLKSNEDSGWLMQKHYHTRAELLSVSNDKKLETNSHGRTSLLNVKNCEFKLIETLERHKDILKKRILKKRSLLERNLQNEIKEEVEVNSIPSNTANIEILKISGVRNDDLSVTDKSEAKQVGNIFNNEKNIDTKVQQPRNKKLSKKKEKLYCICRTPYDDTKFYVGCDLCSNWFHGDCVNITEETSKKLSEYICDDCKSARDTQQLYCSCRQPYDDSQFYICCDKCQDWFHGRCVGIVQSEAEFIDEYICPDCQRNNAVNNDNMKNLTNDEKADLKKLIKQIQSHKSAWPFMEPVNPDEAPDYYKIIKEPMDLQKIEEKLNSNKYVKLSEFIGDMTKIFDNCRYYNPKESSFYKCAETLELYFVQKIKNFRKVAVDGQT